MPGYIIDSVKSRVPIWKMEITNKGNKWLGGTLYTPDGEITFR